MGTTPLLHKSHSLGSLQSTGTGSIASSHQSGSPAKCRRPHSTAHRIAFLGLAALFLLVTICLTCVLLHWLLTDGSWSSASSGQSAAISIRLRHGGGGRQSAAAAAHPPHGRSRFAPVSLDVRDQPLMALAPESERAAPRQANCSHWDCFDVYRCGHGQVADRMSVYVYPLRRYVDAPSGAPAAELSREWLRVLQAVRESRYYTADPREACVFVPSVDLLNENRVDGEVAARALAAMEYWDTGDNHLLFNMVPGTAPHYNRTLDVPTDRAMIAGAGFDTWTYRYGFDLAIPFYMVGLSDAAAITPESATRPFLLIAAQLNLYARHTRILQELAYDHQAEVLLLQECADFGDAANTPRPGAEKSAGSSPNRQHSPVDWRCAFAEPQQRHSYPEVLGSGRFCLVMRGQRLVPLNLLETMAAGCVPVIVADNLVLPFSEILDWTLAVVQVRETNLHSLVTRLLAISEPRVIEMSRQVRWLHRRYFGSLERMVATVLDQLNERIFPHLARDQRAWNQERGAPLAVANPLFLAQTAARAPGFTAVILTYDRVESLYTLIEKLSVVGSLHKVLVVWNNQRKAPPHINQFPKIAKPLQLIRTTANKLSNRFYPYEDIETEAILTIDDDIVMLTADELDFGFEVWREFPDRIVGFPSRTHVWDNGTGRWRYESEWTNDISMVLTGAAFHHKYWSHMYTTAMPGDIKQWVDEHMNCEDIAMNFLVANITGQPPIKVAPRKKFKCPECINTEMLSADLNHMMERSACIDRFSRIYGRMPLRTVEFRADPVLYKDQFPEKLKRFNDIGSL